MDYSHIKVVFLDWYKTLSSCLFFYHDDIETEIV